MDPTLDFAELRSGRFEVRYFVAFLENVGIHVFQKLPFRGFHRTFPLHGIIAKGSSTLAPTCE